MPAIATEEPKASLAALVAGFSLLSCTQLDPALLNIYAAPVLLTPLISLLLAPTRTASASVVKLTDIPNLSIVLLWVIFKLIMRRCTLSLERY